MAQLAAEFCPNVSSGNELDDRLARTRAALRAGEWVVLFSDMFKSLLGVEPIAEAVVGLRGSTHQGTMHGAGERVSIYDFQREAMTALGIPTDRLEAEPMLEVGVLLRDTSLDTSLWTRLTGSRPLTVAETLVSTSRGC